MTPAPKRETTKKFKQISKFSSEERRRAIYGHLPKETLEAKGVPPPRFGDPSGSTSAFTSSVWEGVWWSGRDTFEKVKMRTEAKNPGMYADDDDMGGGSGRIPGL